MKKKKLISFLLAGFCSLIVFYVILTSGIFNFLPYLIHKEFLESYSSNGDDTAIIDEASFIIFFDVVASIIFLFFAYKFVFWFLSKEKSIRKE